MRDLKSPQYRKWRDLVYKKDNYTCQKCGTQRKLEAHHIESWNSNPKERFKVSTGVTLCEDCHYLFHKKYGKGNNNVYQLEKFLRRKMDRVIVKELFNVKNTKK